MLERETPDTNDENKTIDLEVQYKKYNRCSWCCGITAFILITIGSLTPFLMNKLIYSAAKKSTTLT